MGNRLVELRLQTGVIVLALLLIAAQLNQLRKPKVDIEKKLDSVVMVATDAGHGTGFFIDKDGCVMTAFHVVDAAVRSNKPIYLMLRGDPRKYEAKPVSGNSFLDVAVVCSSVTWVEPLKIVGTENIKQGDHVWTMGHPGDAMWNVTDGVVSRLSYRMHMTERKVPVPPVTIGPVQAGPFLLPKITLKGRTVTDVIWMPRYDLIVSAFISWGSSGGPVLNDNGDVVGMIVEWEDVGNAHPGSMNVAVPGTDLLRFIRSVWGKS